MGEVYRARDTRLKRDVALKVLADASMADPDRRARFEREARTIAALDHPGIVSIHSIEEQDGIAFITMQLVQGRTLAESIPPAGLSLQRIFDIGIGAYPDCPILAALRRRQFCATVCMGYRDSTSRR